MACSIEGILGLLLVKWNLARYCCLYTRVGLVAILDRFSQVTVELMTVPIPPPPPRWAEMPSSLVPGCLEIIDELPLHY